MKNILFIGSLVCCLICALSHANAQELTFDYDAAGNQITRRWICVNCSNYEYASFFTKQGVVVTQASTPINASEDRKLIAFPNPLVETLNLRWENVKYYIKSVDVSTINGTRVYSESYRYIEGVTQVSVPFSKQIPGMYLIRVTYSDGKQEIVRVIKNGF